MGGNFVTVPQRNYRPQQYFDGVSLRLRMLPTRLLAQAESDQNRTLDAFVRFQALQTGSGAFGWSVARLPLCVNWRRRKNFGSFLGEVVMKGFWGRRTGLALGALIGSVVASTLAQADGVAAGPGPISAQKMWLSCENGRDYPLHPLAVSREVRSGDGIPAGDRPRTRRARAPDPDGQRLSLCGPGRLVRRHAPAGGAQLGPARRSALQGDAGIDAKPFGSSALKSFERARMGAFALAARSLLR